MASVGQSADTNSVKEHMARLRMKLVQQKIQNEKDRLMNRTPSQESTNNDMENQARLQQAMLRRQELLDKIRTEQTMNEDKRPRTYSARRRYTPSPLPVPPTRRSLPDIVRYQNANQGNYTYRSNPDMSQTKHIVEHRIANPTPKPSHLPPINTFRPQPPVIYHPPPPPQIMQAPAPQIIQAPGPQHVITGYPNPVIHNLGPTQPDNRGMFNKGEFGDMMMMQNSQMHQLVMQKMMLNDIGMGSTPPSSAHSKHHGQHGCSQNGCSQNGCSHNGCSHGHCYPGVPWGSGPCGPVPCAPVCPPTAPWGLCPPPPPPAPAPYPRAGSGAVHHHHYTSPPPSQPPPVTHYTTMPAMDYRTMPMRGGGGPKEPKTMSPRPATRQIPVVHQSPQRPKVVTIPVYVKKRVIPQRIALPKKSVNTKVRQLNPGSVALQRFRYVSIALAFIAHLKTKLRKNLSNRPSSVFLFGIILKEIVAALHRIYLNPSGNIYPVLSDIIGPNCYDLSALITGPLDQKDESVLVQELQYVIENVIYHITEIMPSTGVLGTHRKSAVFELIHNGKRFPDGYFWQVEMERLQFTEQGRTVNIGDFESFMLLVGIFISRSLVTTLLMKPTDYGLSSSPLSDVAERNLRIVASTLLYLVRRIALSRSQGIMGMPQEIAKYLYDDSEMEHIFSRLSRTFNYCEGLLREWGTEYVRRLRACTMQASQYS